MKKTLAVLFAVLLICGLCIPTFAAAVQPDVEPLLQEETSTNFLFEVYDPNIAEVTIIYNGTSTFAQAEVEVYIEKHVVGVFWMPVLVNGSDKWTASSTERSGTFYQTTTVSGEGLYQARCFLWITDQDGTTELIKETVECDYAG